MDRLDFTGRQQLLRLMLEDVRVQGWQVELRLRIPLDQNPPDDTATPAPLRTGKRDRSPRGRGQAKEAVSSNDGLRSIGQRVLDLPRLRLRAGVPARAAEQRHRTLTLIEVSSGKGQTRVAEMNEQVLTSLDRMISEIEKTQESGATDAG